MLFADNLPKTKQIPSLKLLLPAPFGPITVEKFSPNSNSVNFANDLKPYNLSFFIVVILYLN